MENNNEIVIYQSQDGQAKLDVRLEGETVWLTQDQMAELFDRDRTAINRHINNIFAEGELDKNVVCANFAHTTSHGAMEGKTHMDIEELPKFAYFFALLCENICKCRLFFVSLQSQR